MSTVRFPDGFLWGVATAAYQIEGAARADGRGESIWDRFSRTPGNTRDGDTGDVACDHYYRYREDVALMAGLGVQAYRFSVAWPRIFPTGAGQPNPKGLDFYRRLVDELLARGIAPAATLYHWDLPQALQDRGGWANRDTAYRFADYADCLFRHLGDRVPMWITHNEPFCTSFVGHALGRHAPGLTNWRAALQAAHHVLLSHGLAVQAFRAANLRTRVGITLNLTPQEPATAGPADAAAARRADGWQNRWFLDPVFRGAYPADMLETWGPLFDPACVHGGDMAAISAPLDFLGVNYYRRELAAGGGPAPLGYTMRRGPGPVTEMGWEVYPAGLTDLLLRLQREYNPPPMYITENGAAFADQAGPDGTVHDPDRAAFLREHFRAAHAAIAAGADLRGFFVWSLMDNFEWAHGYSKRFGIVYVDYPTQRRIPKASAAVFRQAALTGEV